MKRPRRNHTAAYKAKVALAALKGDKTLAELSEKFDVHASQIVQWKTQLLGGASAVFLTSAERRDSQGPSAKDMQAKIGQLAL
jgi:transposase-like protein